MRLLVPSRASCLMHHPTQGSCSKSQVVLVGVVVFRLWQPPYMLSYESYRYPEKTKMHLPSAKINPATYTPSGRRTLTGPLKLSISGNHQQRPAGHLNITMWGVIKTMVPFWVCNVVRQVCRGPKRGPSFG